jgi:hypothetical protein
MPVHLGNRLGQWVFGVPLDLGDNSPESKKPPKNVIFSVPKVTKVHTFSSWNQILRVVLVGVRLPECPAHHPETFSK